MARLLRRLVLRLRIEMSREQKLTAGDLVEAGSLIAICAGAWIAWGLGVSLVIVGSIALLVALLSRWISRRRPGRERAG